MPSGRGKRWRRSLRQSPSPRSAPIPASVVKSLLKRPLHLSPKIQQRKRLTAALLLLGRQGAVDASRSEVALVAADPQAGRPGEYVFCAITSEQEDQRWESDNAGNALLREVSRTLWRHWGGSIREAEALPHPSGLFQLE